MDTIETIKMRIICFRSLYFMAKIRFAEEAKLNNLVAAHQKRNYATNCNFIKMSMLNLKSAKPIGTN
jgi:hypothetical protein